MPPTEAPLILSVVTQVTEKELIRALQYHDWGNPDARRRLLLRAGGFILAGLVCWAVAIAAKIWWLSAPGALGLMIGVYWPLILWSQPKGLAKLYAKQPRIKDPVTTSVRPEALVVASVHGELRLDWHSIRQISVTGDLTLFSLGRYQVVTIPWRCFEAPSAAQRFTELAREYWVTMKDTPRRALVVPDDVAEALGPERLVIQYDLTQPEVRRLIASQLRRKPRLLLTFGLTAVGSFALIYAFSGPVFAVIVGVSVFVLMVALIFGIAVFSTRGAKGVLGPHLLAAGPSGLWSTTTEHGQSWANWPTITSIEGDQTSVLLFRGPDFVTCIPRRCFKSTEDADHFLTQLTRWRVAAPSQPVTPSKLA